MIEEIMKKAEELESGKRRGVPVEEAVKRLQDIMERKRLVGIGSRVPREIYEKIEREAKEQGVTKSAVIRHHLTEYYIIREENKELQELVSKKNVEIDNLREENRKLKKEVEYYQDKASKKVQELLEEIEKLKKEVDGWKRLYAKHEKELNKPIWQKLKFW